MATDQPVGDRTMGLRLIRYFTTGATPYYSLGLLLLLLGYLLSLATQDSSTLNSLFLPLLGIGLITLLWLMIILGRSLLHLYRDYRNKAPGSKLTVRLVSVFAVLILVSTFIVYSFSVHFLHRGIDSWFNVKIEAAINNALELSRTSFGMRMRTLLRQTRMMAGLLGELPASELNHNIRELVKLSGAKEMSVWSMDGSLLISSMQNPDAILPSRPSESVFNQLARGEDYIAMDPEQDNLQLRVAVRLPHNGLFADKRFLQVIFPIDKHLSALGHTVQKAYQEYKELNYLRKPLISVFTLVLSLIVLLTLLASVWFAIWIARRIVEPLQALASATQAVASGNYSMQLTPSGHDEIGFLVRSFNQMTQRLTHARHATQHSHQQLEQQTNYLTAVLSSLSSGVITIDAEHVVHTANQAASDILGIALSDLLARPLLEIGKEFDHLRAFFQLIEQKNHQYQSWQQQIEILQRQGRQTLMCRGTLLPNETEWVIVFDDITALLQAQRNAAWGEVARRLAHEIKNPLTPIQLSAERLRHKYLPVLDIHEGRNLAKLTETIIKQVEAMKEMVNDFSEYARDPGLKLEKQSILPILKEVLTLYKSNNHHQFRLQGEPCPGLVCVDKNRFRQVIHNVLKNAIEASEDVQKAVVITIDCARIIDKPRDWLEIRIQDHGPGIPESMLDRLFEPYATSKQKGTGLGLAIVKKIIEEHHGRVWAENRQGACIIIRLPIEEP